MVSLTRFVLFCFFTGVIALKSHRSTERLNITFLDEAGKHIVFLVSQCKQGLVKTHQLSFEQSSILAAQFDPASARNFFTARTNLMQNALRNVFGSEEAALAVDSEYGIRIKSHFQHASSKSEFETLKTDISVASDELDTVKLDKANDEIAFNLREVKALLQFCESNNIPTISFMFSGAGDPLLVSSDLDPRNKDDGSNDNNGFLTNLQT